MRWRRRLRVWGGHSPADAGGGAGGAYHRPGGDRGAGPAAVDL